MFTVQKYGWVLLGISATLAITLGWTCWGHWCASPGFEVNRRKSLLSCVFPVKQRQTARLFKDICYTQRAARIVSWKCFLSPFWTSSSRPRRISGILCSPSSTPDPELSIFLKKKSTFSRSYLQHHKHKGNSCCMLTSTPRLSAERSNCRHVTYFTWPEESCHWLLSVQVKGGTCGCETTKQLRYANCLWEKYGCRSEGEEELTTWNEK